VRTHVKCVLWELDWREASTSLTRATEISAQAAVDKIKCVSRLPRDKKGAKQTHAAPKVRYATPVKIKLYKSHSAKDQISNKNLKLCALFIVN
jgi:hypothetical protein